MEQEEIESLGLLFGAVARDETGKVAFSVG